MIVAATDPLLGTLILATPLEIAMITAIYDRIKAKPITLKEDDALRAVYSVVRGRPTPSAFGGLALFSDAHDEMDRWRAAHFTKEREAMVRDTAHVFRRR